MALKMVKFAYLAVFLKLDKLVRPSYMLSMQNQAAGKA